MQVPLLLVYICVHKFYTRSYIELQRIDAVRPPHWLSFQSMRTMCRFCSISCTTRLPLCTDILDPAHGGTVY